jgi:N-acetylmuramoyl-L-alanine amidase
MSFVCQTYNKKLLSGCFFCFFLLVIFILTGVSHGRSLSPAEQAVNNPGTDSRQQYKSAKDYYYRLERDTSFGKDRANWLVGIRKFRKIYQADTKSVLAPSCLYMMGRMYRRMYKQFNLPIDIDEAISSFNEVASNFSNNSLADDALFTIADIELTCKNNPARAIKIYQNLIQRFPDGDKSSQSISRLKELARKHDIKVPEQLTTSKAANRIVNVLPVQYWSSNDYTRVVISASAPVHYTARLLEKNNNQPRRLYLDFKQSYISPKFRSPVPIEDGLLKQVRTGQIEDSTVRVVLDIETISDYKIFNLKDPFRVVVDVRGAKKEKAKTASAHVQHPLTPPVVKTEPKTIQPVKSKAKKNQDAFITLDDRKKIRPSSSTAAVDEAATNLSLAQQLGLGVRRIVIDSGHGGKDPGAMAFGLKEKDIVLDVARRTASILKKQHNYEVIMTRDSDIFLPLEERTAIANTRNADLFVSIHVNAHPKKSAKGVETFYLNLATNAEAMRVAARENATSTHNISELQDILSDLMQNAKINESSQLAEFVQGSLVEGLKDHKYKTKNLGVKQAPFYVLIGAEMPAVLAEISFITNPEEAKHLKEDTYLQTIAEQIAAGVSTYVEHRKTAALKL